MTQLRDRERKTPVDSYILDRMNQGLIHWGRYQGFDTLTGVSGLNFGLAHDGSAHKNYARDTYAATNNLGIWRTRQGLTITEDGTVSGLTCGTNAANAFERIDAVVGIHQYSDTITGGVAATYSIIAGATGGPVKPGPSSTDQVILGYIHIPASAANLSAATWEPADVLGLGGLSIARKDAINRFTAQQQMNQNITPITIVQTTLPGGGRTRQIVTLPAPMDANAYFVDANLGSGYTFIHGISAAPIGTILFLIGDNSNITLKPNGMNTAERAAGYQPLENYLADASDVAFSYLGTLCLMSCYSSISGYNVWRIMFLSADDQYRLKTLEDAVTLLGSFKVGTRAVGSISKTTLTNSIGTFTYWRDNNNNVWVWFQWQTTAVSGTQIAVATFPAGFRPGQAIFGNSLSSNVALARGSWKVTSGGAISVNGESTAIGTVFEGFFSFPAES